MAQLPPRIGELFTEVQGHHDNPLAQLLAAQALIQELEPWLADLVAEARSKGITWTTIGLCLGVTPQAVQKRFKGKGHVQVDGGLTIEVGLGRVAGSEPTIVIGHAGTQVTTEAATDEATEAGVLDPERLRKAAKKAKKAAKKAAAAQGQPATPFDPIALMFQNRFAPAPEGEAPGQGQQGQGHPIEVILEGLRKQGDLDQLAGIKVAMKVAEDLASSGLFGVKVDAAPADDDEDDDEDDE